MEGEGEAEGEDVFQQLCPGAIVRKQYLGYICT